MMKPIKKKLVIAGLCLVSSLIPLKALASSFPQLFIFGDSLVDEGNVSDFTGGAIPPSPPYSEGRFSNGQIWTEYLADTLGLNPTNYSDIVLSGASFPDGINFGFGGATTSTENTLSLTFPNLPTQLPGLAQEIAAFTTTFAPTANPDALYIIWAGANNYLPTAGTYTPQTTTTEAIANLSLSIQSLASVGAKNILVVNLPDLGKIPATLNTPISGPLDAISNQHNSELVTTVDNLESSLPVNFIELLDVNSLFDDILSEPDMFGFTNVTESCLQASCTNADEYLFWDSQHPTTAGYEAIADLAIDTLGIPEPTTILGLLSFAALTLRLRKKV